MPLHSSLQLKETCHQFKLLLQHGLAQMDAAAPCPRLSQKRGDLRFHDDLGHDHAGLFASDDALAGQLLAAGLATGEKVWRMPLGPAYDKQIESKFADIKNTGGRDGGSVTAAQFLKRFVKDGTPWAHLDIAGTAMGSPQSETNRSWASGWGVRLLDRFVADNHEG